METGLSQVILTVQNLLNGAGFGPDATLKAQTNGWLDEHGKPTPDGIMLVSALQAQLDQRSVFRNILL